MVYFGIFNGKFKSQAVDRVLFFDRTLFVDGPTTAQTPGYHPAPAMPTFRDLFNEGERSDIQDKWKVESGTWILKSGMLIQSQLSGSHEAFIRSQPSQNYLFECPINLAKF